MAVEIRPSQALRLLHEVSHALVTDGEPDLSARQLDVLFTIYLEPPPHTVRGLAARLHVTKPVITRALVTRPETTEVLLSSPAWTCSSIWLTRNTS